MNSSYAESNVIWKRVEENAYIFFTAIQYKCCPFRFLSVRLEMAEQIVLFF